MLGLTINDLAKCCAKQIEKGYGDKKILISNDDEGNGFHELFYEFSHPQDVFNGQYPPHSPISKNEMYADYVILG